MSKKKSSPSNGIVYSTDPGFRQEEETRREETLLPAQQKLRILLDKKQRAGKAVTLVTGYSGTDADAEELGKKLKGFCGTGGSVKDREILIQGDQREKVLQWLKNNGFTQAKKV